MVDGAVLISTLISLAAAPRWTRRVGNPGAGRRGRRWARPEAFLALVVGLVYVNQVLFTVYMLRVHGGDASFIAKYLPEGYFALADGSAMRGLAEHFPKPELLAPGWIAAGYAAGPSRRCDTSGMSGAEGNVSVRPV